MASSGRRVWWCAAALTLLGACSSSGPTGAPGDGAGSDASILPTDASAADAAADSGPGRDGSAPGPGGDSDAAVTTEASADASTDVAPAHDGSAADGADAAGVTLADGSLADGSLADGSSEDAPAASAAGDGGLGVDDASAFDARGDGGAAAADASEAGDAMVPDLLLYYSFDDGAGTTIIDRSPGGHDGTLQIDGADGGDAAAIPTWTTAGRVKGALTFSAGDHVTLPSGVLAGAKAMTVSVWVNLARIEPWARVLDFGHGPSGVIPNDRWAFLTPSGLSGVQWDFYTGATPLDAGSPDVAVLSGTQLPTDVWKHLAVTADGTSYALYIDGFPAAKATGSAIAPSELEPLAPQSALGHSRFADPNLTGTMDELRIYSRALSVAEIEGLAYPKMDYSSWHFDEGSGTTALDSSDNVIPTTLVGGAAWTPNGRLGAAVDLSGIATPPDAGFVGPYVLVGGNPLASCTSSLTVSAWVNLRSSAPWTRIFDFGTPSVGAGSRFIYLTPTDGSGVHFAMISPNGRLDLVATGKPVPIDRAWHHVAVTVAPDASTVIYLDGNSVATGAAAGVRPGDFADAGVTANWLGKSRFGDPYLDGSLDELRISCRAYTADEIKSLAFSH